MLPTVWRAVVCSVIAALGACTPHALASGAASAPRAATSATPLVARELKDPAETALAIREYYTKYEYKVPMRDGVRLHTAVYVPKDSTRPWPMLMTRTPYGVPPYGSDNYPREPREIAHFAPSPALLKQGYVFVHQDVRGKMNSEGVFVDVRPVSPDMAAKTRRDPHVVDETTDAYDSVEWLVKHVPNNNGELGAWGISYPGFYAAQLAISGHPAVRAVSAEAPVTEWFAGDDFHHNGAFFLADSFDFTADFGKPHPAPTVKSAWDFERTVPDLYAFFLGMGPLAGADERYMGGPRTFWRDVVAHGTRDAYWQAADPRAFYKNVKPAMLTVGGWYDAEDLFGALETYKSFERQSPGARNHLLMGPWTHGGWSRGDGDKLGDISFGAKTALRYGNDIALRFFEQHLKGVSPPALAEATIFETGTNTWREFSTWPPAAAKTAAMMLLPAGQLAAQARRPGSVSPSFDEYTSDPSKPVPYIGKATTQRGNDYMSADQRFAARRPDVLVYTSAVIGDEVAVCGLLEADIWVSTSGTDSDFVVKLVDMHPDDSSNLDSHNVPMGGYQELVRAEVMRAKFRSSLAIPEPMIPGEPTRLRFALPDVCHSFRPGHRMVVQVQSTWFPLVDRNPQMFMDIYQAKGGEFQVARQRVYHDVQHRSELRLSVTRGVLP